MPTSSSLRAHLLPSSSHLRRLGQWRRRGRGAAANGSAPRAQNEGSRVKTNDFYFGNQSEEERGGGRTVGGHGDSRWCRQDHRQGYFNLASGPLPSLSLSLSRRSGPGLNNTSRVRPRLNLSPSSSLLSLSSHVEEKKTAAPSWQSGRALLRFVRICTCRRCRNLPQIELKGVGYSWLAAG